MRVVVSISTNGLFDSSVKSAIDYVFIVLLTDHRHQIVQYIFLYNWDIAATAESTSGRRFCALFEYVLYYPEGSERTGDIRFSWVDVTTAAGPILLRLGLATKMVVFSRFCRSILRWLITVSSTFQYSDFDVLLQPLFII